MALESVRVKLEAGDEQSGDAWPPADSSAAPCFVKQEWIEGASDECPGVGTESSVRAASCQGALARGLQLDAECVKDEGEDGTEEDWLCGVSSAAARAGLYTGHAVKGELVLGPELLQAPHITIHVSGASSELRPASLVPEGASGECFEEDLRCSEKGKKHIALRPCFVKPERIPIDKSPPTSKKQLSATGGTPHLHDTRAEQVPNTRRSALYRREQAHTTAEHYQRTKKNPFKCDICSKQFTRRSDLDAHERIHTGVETFSCDVCDKQFARLSYLHSHKRVHTGVKPFACDFCNRQFARLSYLSSHKRVHTGVKPFSCDVCNKRFAQSGTLSSHKLTHTGVKQFACDVCNKQFARLDSLGTHKRIHTGVKPFACDVCNKRFAQSGTLRSHKLTHTGMKQFACDVCNKRFAHSGALRSHERIHSGVKPFACDVCNKRFVQSCNLNIHKRVHTGEKPYSCYVCNKRFSRLRELDIHKLFHTGVNPFRCDVCNKQFTHPSSLAKHERAHLRSAALSCLD